MTSLESLPGWVVRLVADLEYHEDVHPAGADHWCVQPILDRVPAEARAFARGWAACARQAEADRPAQPCPDLPSDAALEGGGGR